VIERNEVESGLIGPNDEERVRKRCDSSEEWRVEVETPKQGRLECMRNSAAKLDEKKLLKILSCLHSTHSTSP